MSKKPPDMSKDMEYHKTTFANILSICGQGKIRIKPYSQIRDSLSRAEGTTQDGSWEICFQLIPLSLQTKFNKLSLIWIQFEFPS